MAVIMVLRVERLVGKHAGDCTTYPPWDKDGSKRHELRKHLVDLVELHHY
jgi:hypothetical protein